MESPMKINKRVRLIIIAFGIAFSISSCVQIAPRPPEDFPYELMLSPLDVSSRWIRLGGSFPEDVPDEVISNLVVRQAWIDG